VAKLPLTPVTKEQPDVVFKDLQNKPPVTEKTNPTTELFQGQTVLYRGPTGKTEKPVQKAQAHTA